MIFWMNADSEYEGCVGEAAGSYECLGAVERLRQDGKDVVIYDPKSHDITSQFRVLVKFP